MTLHEFGEDRQTMGGMSIPEVKAPLRRLKGTLMLKHCQVQSTSNRKQPRADDDMVGSSQIRTRLHG